ncbi:MAG: adenosylcobinamide amidohydrolase [Nitrospirae bacterium]|nr:adenosylcobinamide amidohydrolase [Nitrospirota bacterium]
MYSRKIDLDLEGIKAEIIYHHFNDIEIKTFLLSFDTRRRVLSTLEGFKEVKFVGNHYNPPQLWDFVHNNKKSYEEKIYTDLGLNLKDVAMLYTGANIDNISIKTEEYKNVKISACVTAGVKSNAQRIGEDKAGSIEIKEGEFKSLGTVNIILLTNASFSDGAMARSIITITEAKTIAFEDLNIRSSYNPEIQATGTGTDNIIVVPGLSFGQKITYTGGHAKAGEIMARVVTNSVKEAILKQEKDLK